METFSALLALCAGNSPVPVNSPHKDQWRGALMFSLICVVLKAWVNNRETGDLRRHRAHYDVIVMYPEYMMAPWHGSMETLPALLALCGGNPPGTGRPSQRPVMQSFNIFFKSEVVAQTVEMPAIWRNDAPLLWHYCSETSHSPPMRARYPMFFGVRLMQYIMSY